MIGLVGWLVGERILSKRLGMGDQPNDQPISTQFLLASWLDGGFRVFRWGEEKKIEEVL